MTAWNSALGVLAVVMIALIVFVRAGNGSPSSNGGEQSAKILGAAGSSLASVINALTGAPATGGSAAV